MTNLQGMLSQLIYEKCCPNTSSRNVVMTNLQGMLSQPIYKECCRKKSTRNAVTTFVQEMLWRTVYKERCRDQSTRNVVKTNLWGMSSRQIYNEYCHKKIYKECCGDTSTRNVVVKNLREILSRQIEECAGKYLLLVPGCILQLVHPLGDLPQPRVHPQESGGLQLQGWAWENKFLNIATKHMFYLFTVAYVCLVKKTSNLWLASGLPKLGCPARWIKPLTSGLPKLRLFWLVARTSSFWPVSFMLFCRLEDRVRARVSRAVLWSRCS